MPHGRGVIDGIDTIVDSVGIHCVHAPCRCPCEDGAAHCRVEYTDNVELMECKKIYSLMRKEVLRVAAHAQHDGPH